VMDLRQLEYFLKIAERRSFTAAAGDLRITQPSLTKSMRLLEQDLGVALFRRLPRGVELTPFGAALARHARLVRVQVREALGEIENLRQGVSGRIAIGAGPAWLRRILPLAVAAVIAERPLVRIQVIGGFDEALLRGLRLGELDACVVEVPSPEECGDLDVAQLSSDELVVIARDGHPLAGGAPVNVSGCLGFPWVLPPRATRARRRLDALFVSRELPPPEASVETESGAFMMALLLASDALTYTTRRAIEQPEAHGTVVIDVPGLAAERIAGFITRRGQPRSLALEALFESLSAFAAADRRN